SSVLRIGVSEYSVSISGASAVFGFVSSRFFVSFRFISFRFVSFFRLVSFRFVSFRFVLSGRPTSPPYETKRNEMAETGLRPAPTRSLLHNLALLLLH